MAVVEEAPKAHAPTQVDVPVRLAGPGPDVQLVGVTGHIFNVHFIRLS